MKRWKLTVLFAVLGLMAYAWAHGTTLVYLSLEDLTNLSDDVVIGHVVETRSYLERDGQTIFTAVTLELEESLKGDSQQGQRITFHHLGGEVDGIALRYASMPVFHEGGDVAVFLKELGPDTFGLVGLGQGVLDVVPRRDSRLLVRRLEAMRFINAEFPGRGAFEEDHGDETYTFQEFRGHVDEAPARRLRR